MKSQSQKETKKLTIMKCNMEEKIEKILSYFFWLSAAEENTWKNADILREALKI